MRESPLESNRIYRSSSAIQQTYLLVRIALDALEHHGLFGENRVEFMVQIVYLKNVENLKPFSTNHHLQLNSTHPALDGVHSHVRGPHVVLHLHLHVFDRVGHVQEVALEFVEKRVLLAHLELQFLVQRHIAGRQIVRSHVQRVQQVVLLVQVSVESLKPSSQLSQLLLFAKPKLKPYLDIRVELLADGRDDTHLLLEYLPGVALVH